LWLGVIDVFVLWTSTFAYGFHAMDQPLVVFLDPTAHVLFLSEYTT